MAKNGKKSFLDYFKINETSAEYDDDLFDDDDDDEDDFDDFDDDDDDEYEAKPSTVKRTSPARTYQAATQNGASAAKKTKTKTTRSASSSQSGAGNNSKLVSFNRAQSAGQEVFVIKPDEFDDAQMIIDHLRGGQAIVINMEGMDLSIAQRIIDFIAGACYSIDGSLQAISGNIFIAAPADIYVSGDLREELLNDAFRSPELGRY